MPSDDGKEAADPRDLRDLLISQQIRRIDELERKIEMLDALLQKREGRAVSVDSGVSVGSSDSGERSGDGGLGGVNLSGGHSNDDTQMMAA